MRRVGVAASLGALCLAVAALIAGGSAAPIGRVLLWGGLPRLAEPLLRDPAWRGVASYRAGRSARAAEAFEAAGTWLNVGNARVLEGEYAAALEAYDRARLAGDDRADANFDLVAAYYASLMIDPDAAVSWFATLEREGATVAAQTGQGSGRAASDGAAATNTGALVGLPEVVGRNLVQEGVRKVFDETFMMANERWLATLPDVPGAYLAERIAHERKRRAELGLAPPDPEDPT